MTFIVRQCVCTDSVRVTLCLKLGYSLFQQWRADVIYRLVRADSYSSALVFYVADKHELLPWATRQMGAGICLRVLTMWWYVPNSVFIVDVLLIEMLTVDNCVSCAEVQWWSVCVCIYACIITQCVYMHPCQCHVCWQWDMCRCLTASPVGAVLCLCDHGVECVEVSVSVLFVCVCW